MATEAASQADECRIGEWIFAPAANELRCGDDRRRLEHRAARTLELLCRRRGAIVSQEEIIAEVWNGRAVSANSVPVVIRDLRQALGDDARRPRHIETVAKRGYRLIAGPEEAQASTGVAAVPARQRPGSLILIVAAALLVTALVAWLALRPFGPEPVRLVVTEVENATGSAAWQPLASASSAVIMRNAERLEGVRTFPAGKGEDLAGAVTLRSSLIMWNGRPTVTMSAQAADGAVIWTGMTSGEEALIPGEVSAAMDELEGKLRDGR